MAQIAAVLRQLNIGVTSLRERTAAAATSIALAEFPRQLLVRRHFFGQPMVMAQKSGRCDLQSHVFIFHRFAGEWVGDSIKILRFDVGMKFDMRISSCVGPILRTPCAQKLTRLLVDSLSTINRKSLIGPDHLASVVRMYSSMCRSHIKFVVLSIAFKTAELMQKRSVDGPIPNFRAS